MLPIPTRVFKKYVADREDEWEDGRVEMDSTSLMLLASNKYRTMKTKNIWEAPLPEEEKMIALEACFAELKKRLAEK